MDRRVRRAIVYCSSYLGLGICFAVVGPTFLALVDQVDSTVSKLSLIFPASSVGWLTGSAIGGTMFNEHSNTDLYMGVDCLLMGLITIAFPFATTPVMLIAFSFLKGLTGGFLDTGGNFAIFTLFSSDDAGEDNQLSIAMQSLHFAFGLGAFLAPTVIHILQIASGMHTEEGSLPTGGEAGEASLGFNDTASGNGTVPEDGYYADAQLVHEMTVKVYTVVGLFAVPLAVLLLRMARQRRPYRYSKLDSDGEASGNVAVGSDDIDPVSTTTVVTHAKVAIDDPKTTYKLVGLLSLFCLLYVGTEIGLGSYIYTYAMMLPAFVDKSKATLLNSAFWGCFAFGRGIAIWIATWCRASRMLMADLALSITAAFSMWYWSESASVLWGATCLFGLSMASAYPSGLSLGGKYVRMTGKMTSVTVFASAFGEMIFPMLIGGFIESNPHMMTVIVLGAILATTCAFVLLYVIGESHLRKKRLRGVSSEMELPERHSTAVVDVGELSA